MRVLTWNMHGATASRQSAWEYVLELAPDIAVLQEVGAVPLQVAAEYDSREAPAVRKDGRPQRFKSATLVRGRVVDTITLHGPEGWIGRELERFAGNVLSLRVEPTGGPAINLINVYNPAWPLDRASFKGADTGAVRLTQQARDIWLADLLWSSLKMRRAELDEPWVVAGDFNLSESFDSWPGGPHGNREYLDRLADLGLVECLRQHSGRPVPTFKNADGGEVLHQIDHVFVSKPLAASLRSAATGCPERVFGGKMSDHLPIIAEFDVE